MQSESLLFLEVWQWDQAMGLMCFHQIFNSFASSSSPSTSLSWSTPRPPAPRWMPYSRPGREVRPGVVCHLHLQLFLIIFLLIIIITTKVQYHHRCRRRPGRWAGSGTNGASAREAAREAEEMRGTSSISRDPHHPALTS